MATTMRGCFNILSTLAIGLLALAAPLRAEFAHVANSLGTGGYVSAFRIDPTTGALTPIPGSPFPAGSVPISVAVDPLGKFAYVANELDNTVSAYSIDSETGALARIPGSPFATGIYPLSVAVDPSGKFAYVSNGSSSVSEV